MIGLRFVALSATVLLTAAACTTTAGGGGGIGGGTFYPASGGQAGSACNPETQNEGCLVITGGYARMQCPPGGTAWTQIGTCTANENCLEQADPNDPGQFKKITACQAKPTVADATGTDDAGSLPQDDAKVTVNDGGGDPPVDGGGNPPVDGGGNPPVDGGGNPPVDGGGNPPVDAGGDPVGAWLACAQSQCGSPWAACAADAACKAAAGCVDKCAANKTCEQSCVGSAGESGALLASVMMCAVEMECGPSAGPKCGNGQCEVGETASTCAQDCGLPSPVCGDGKCEGSENASNCVKDCGTPSKCGDGKCDAGENAATCPADCGGGANSCVGKCGEYKESNPCQCDTGCTEYGDCCADYAKVCGGGSTPKCGDGKCDPGETTSSCPADCGGGSSGGLIACMKTKCASQYSACKAASGCNGLLIFLAAGECIEVNKCGSDAACQQAKCADEIAACQPGSPCGTLNSCLSKCNQGDQTCQGKCIAVGGSQYQALGTCAQSNGCE